MGKASAGLSLASRSTVARSPRADAAIASTQTGAVAPAVSSSDHFSYLLQPEIIDFITSRANDLPGQHAVTAEEPAWLVAQRAGHVSGSAMP